MYAREHRLDATVADPELKALALAQVPERELLPELSPIMEQLLSPIYSRHFIAQLRPERGPDYTQYRALRGHTSHFALSGASRVELLDLDSLPERFTLHYLGPARSLKQLRRRIQRLRDSVEAANEKGYKHRRQVDLPVVNREIARTWIAFYRRCPCPDQPRAGHCVLLVSRDSRRLEDVPGRDDQFLDARRGIIVEYTVPTRGEAPVRRHASTIRRPPAAGQGARRGSRQVSGE